MYYANVIFSIQNVSKNEKRGGKYLTESANRSTGFRIIYLKKIKFKFFKKLIVLCQQN